MMQLIDESTTGSQAFFGAARVVGRGERRLSRRYDVGLPMRIRVLQTGTPSEWFSGTVLDLSSTGVSFQCRRPLVENARIEIVIDWPSSRNTRHPVCLRASGEVVRTYGNRNAARITSSHMRIEKAASAASAPKH